MRSTVTDGGCTQYTSNTRLFTWCHTTLHGSRCCECVKTLLPHPFMQSSLLFSSSTSSTFLYILALILSYLFNAYLWTAGHKTLRVDSTSRRAWPFGTESPVTRQCEVAADSSLCGSQPGCSPRRRTVVAGCPGVSGLVEWPDAHVWLSAYHYPSPSLFFLLVATTFEQECRSRVWKLC